jgi:hypothetical protein
LTLTEAQALAELFSQADERNYHCCLDLCREANDKFDGFRWEIDPTQYFSGEEIYVRVSRL